MAYKTRQGVLSVVLKRGTKNLRVSRGSSRERGWGKPAHLVTLGRRCRPETLRERVDIPDPAARPRKCRSRRPPFVTVAVTGLSNPALTMTIEPGLAGLGQLRITNAAIQNVRIHLMETSPFGPYCHSGRAAGLRTNEFRGFNRNCAHFSRAMTPCEPSRRWFDSYRRADNGQE